MGHDISFKDAMKCPKCGYYNLKQNWQLYGTCTRCHEVLDEKIKFKFEMYNKLKLWKGKLR